MKKNITRMPRIIVFIMAVALLQYSCNTKSSSEEKKTETLVTQSTTATCTCESDWFPHTPDAPDGNGSPFDTSSTSNCIFHQWAVQKFLYLTKPATNGQARFGNGLILVNNQMVPTAPVNGVSLVIEDSTQAGSDAVLRSNAAYSSKNNSYTVYYGIFINPTLQNAADSFRKQLLADTSLIANNTFTFPVHSLEVKTAWIDTNALPVGQAANYYTTQALIMPAGITKTVALLGVHIVGVVKNHPEFIWATFEHKNMAPNYNWAATTTSTDAPVTSANEMLFFKKGDTATWNNIQWNSNQHKNVFTVYYDGVPLNPGGGFMNVSQQEPVNQNNIDSLNTCMAAGLTSADVWQNYSYNGAAWINTDGLSATQQADTIAALNFYISSPLPGAILRGSVAEFNITMETYEQDFDAIPLHNMNDSSLSNCFSCHNSPSGIIIGNNTINGNSPLYISHIFRSSLSNSSGVPKNKIEMRRLRDYADMLVARKAMKKK